MKIDTGLSKLQDSTVALKCYSAIASNESFSSKRIKWFKGWNGKIGYKNSIKNLKEFF